MLKVGVRLPALIDGTGEFLADARALDAAGADVIWLEDGSADPWVALGALAAVTYRVRLGFAGASVDEPRADTLRTLSRGRFVIAEPASERWVAVDVAPDRDSWAAMLREHEAGDVTGIVVPWDPRLVDLLRNPDPDDRSDLLMSTG